MEHSQNKLVVYSNQKGVFVSIREKLRIYMAQLHKNKKLNLIENNTITIKFCGDGTNLTKKSSIYNFCFSIIDQKKTCKTAFGHYLIGLFDITENYEDLKMSLYEVIEEINNLKSIQIEIDSTTVDISIVKKFCIDLKDTSLLMGINMANATYPCPFCKFRFLGKRAVSVSESKLYIENLKKSWNLDDPSICRSQYESKLLYNQKLAEDRKGYFNLF